MNNAPKKSGIQVAVDVAGSGSGGVGHYSTTLDDTLC